MIIFGEATNTLRNRFKREVGMMLSSLTKQSHHLNMLPSVEIPLQVVNRFGENVGSIDFLLEYPCNVLPVIIVQIPTLLPNLSDVGIV